MENREKEVTDKVNRLVKLFNEFNSEFGRWKTNALFKYNWDSNKYEINEVILNSLLDQNR